MKRILLTLVACIATTMAVMAQTGKYESDLYLNIGTPIEEGADPMPDAVEVTIIPGETEGTVNFQLLNFMFGETPMGDIKLNNIGLIDAGNGKFTFAENEKVALSLAGGFIQAMVNINAATSYIENGKLYADVDIDWLQEDGSVPIFVRVISKSYNPEPAQVNGTFEGDWLTCIPWDSNNNTQEAGTKPLGWCVSNVISYFGEGSIAMKEVVACGEGNGSEKGVFMNNIDLLGQKIPSYMTLGTTWATAHGSLGSIMDADGGAFGGIKFGYRPDAVAFDYKRDNSKGETEQATVLAYMWKGTWTQKDVPGLTAVMSKQPVNKVDMIDRDRNILGIETATGGEVTASEDAKLIAKLEYAITENNSEEWHHQVVPFEYMDAEADVEKLNIVFSATNYFGDRNAIVGGNSLAVDNVKLVYYSDLKSLSFKGQEVEGFAPETTQYTIQGEYTDGCLTFEKHGVGAETLLSYDADAKVAKIEVRGNDYDVNPANVTVYTVQFTTQSGIDSFEAQPVGGKTIYTLDGRRCYGKLVPGVYVVNGKKVVVK